MMSFGVQMTAMGEVTSSKGDSAERKQASDLKQILSEDPRKVNFHLKLIKLLMQMCIHQNTALFEFVCTFWPGIWVLNGHCVYQLH